MRARMLPLNRLHLVINQLIIIMKKSLTPLCLALALPFLTPTAAEAAVPSYDAAAAKTQAQADFANWMKYLPDDVFVAHVSIPGTHDTATGHGFSGLTSIYDGTSRTQQATIDEQLAGGVRAFDFRPGLSGGKLNCNHGVATTNITMEQAFTKLTSYLDAHPGEFFVIHLFKANVEDSSSSSNKNSFNDLMNEFFNTGKFSNYFIDYDPMLKVGDVRGKIVVFRRDALGFVSIGKAGNLIGWPGDRDLWTTASNKTRVVRESDPTVVGYVRVTDVSSPPDEATVNTELESIKNLYEWCSTQDYPNDIKSQTGIYKPDWTMIFTSGEDKNAVSGGGREAYLANANKTNKHLTDLINNAGKKGPTGIVFSDWVLTDSYGGYSTYGVDLIPAIAYNNFDYIANFLIDEDIFSVENPSYENIWDESKQYFLRNVGTGDFLSAGEWWGTHATTAAHGIKVIPKINKDDGTYYFSTTLSNNKSASPTGTLGTDWYVDNPSSPRNFKATYVGNNAFVFTFEEDGVTKAMSALGIGNQFVSDGTTHKVDADTYVPGTLTQQWEIISVDDYLAQQLRSARRDKGVDVTFLIPGARFFGNDSENDSWSIKITRGYGNDMGAVGENDSRRCLRFWSNKTSNAAWDLSQTVSNLPNGLYTIKWVGYLGIGHNDVTMSINGKDVSDDLRKENGTVGVTETASGFLGMTKTYSITDPVKIGSEMATGNFDCLLKDIKILDGKLTIVAHDNAHPTYNSSVFVLDDFELIYYGSIYPILERAIEDAKRRLGETPDWLAEYEARMNNLDFNQDDEGAAPALEIYQKMRELTLAQTPDDNNHQDYTNALINAGFETGTLMGWETSYQGETGTDTGVKPNEGVYVTQGGQNQFLFNCWQEDPNPDNRGRGVVLSQTIPGLPAGHYMVTAQAANDEGDCIYIEVNGQRSDALIVEEANNISKLISFEFEVAENTEEVTISFMGGNHDGTFDEYGGNWYKVDDIHLYRAGSADFCVFFRRLMTAMERMDKLAAKTLPQYYQDKWDNEGYHMYVAELIRQHLASDHSEGDLNGSNGIEERNELIRHFSAVVLSQAETKANMSGAIPNNSFELGDLSYWTTKASPIALANVTESEEGVYNIAGRDEKNIYFADLTNYEDYNGEAYPIYQTISGLPKGQYRLSVSVASTAGNTFYLAANDASKMITATGDDAFLTGEVEFEITADNSDLTLGLYPSADGTFTSQEANAEVKGPWFAVDNFQLWLIGRQVSIDWTMETPTHGTIILPFAVDADELTEKGLKVFSVTAHVNSVAEGATHHILEYTEQPSIEAHTPYVVQTADAAAQIQSKAVKAAGKRDAEAQKGAVYTFTGFTQHEKLTYTDNYTNGSLTGTFVESNAEGDQYHLQNYEDNIGFVRHEEGVEHETFEPYHAYITLPETSGDAPNIHGLYFEEPTLPLDWYMEGEYYGTIILPFEAEIPADLDAYTVTELGAKTEMPSHYEMPGVYYHLLTIEPVEETDGVRLFAANVPYLVVSKSVESTDEPESALSILSLKAAAKAEDEDAVPPTATFKGQATNTAAFDKVGLLTGVHVDTKLAEDEKLHVIGESGKMGAFVTNVGVGLGQIDAHHAYISADDLPDDHGELLLLAEPQADDETTGIDEILAGDVNVDLYNIRGVLLKADVPAAEALRGLAPGVYILRGGDKTIKVLK